MKNKLFKTLLTSCLCTALLGSTVLAADSTQTLTEASDDLTAEIEVNVEINSTFTVGIPVSTSLAAATGEGSYNITVKGDLDPRYKLDVIPTDKDGSKSGINFYLKDQAALLEGNKDDIMVTVVPSKTSFLYSDINPTTPITVSNTLTASNDITAGKWQGVIEYTIALTSNEVTP